VLVADYGLNEIELERYSREVNDDSGYVHDGTASGAIGKPNIEWASPARSGSIGTCAYGKFAGAATQQTGNCRLPPTLASAALLD